LIACANKTERDDWIRELHALGWTGRRIAFSLGCSASTACLVLDPAKRRPSKGTCKINDEDCCSHGRLTRGLCDTHYRRWWKHGDPLVVLPNVYAPPTSGIAGRPRITNPGYAALHLRVTTDRGKADRCIIYLCHTGSTTYQWANISRRYTDVWDFMSMCIPHHEQYDGRTRDALGRFVLCACSLYIPDLTSPSMIALWAGKRL
jgi:hypothetical protein